MKCFTVVALSLVLFGLSSCQQQVATGDIVPVISCIEDNGDGTFRPRFGYTNFNDFPVYIPRGPDNELKEETTNAVIFPPQIDTFLPGNHMDLFHVVADYKWTVAWKIVSPNGNVNIIRATRTNQQLCNNPPTAPPPPAPVDLCSNKTCSTTDRCCNNTAIGGFAQCFAPNTHWCCINQAGKMMLCGLDSDSCCGNACYNSSQYSCNAVGQLLAGIRTPSTTTSTTGATTSTTTSSTTGVIATTTGTTTGTTTTGTTGTPAPVTCESFNGANGLALDRAGCFSTPGCSYCSGGSAPGSGVCYNLTTSCCANTGTPCSGASCAVCDAGQCCGGFWTTDPAHCCPAGTVCCAGIRHSTCYDPETEVCCGGSLYPCSVPKGQTCTYTADNFECSFNSTAV